MHGDLYDGSARLWHGATAPSLARAVRRSCARSGRARCVRSPPPPEERRGPRGRRHSKRRDAAAISHHYDVSNRFYELDPRPVDGLHLRGLPRRRRHPRGGAVREVRPRVPQARAASRACACSTSGCGWGGMVMHAAEHYGVEALGVTLSREQAEWAQQAIAEAGLTTAPRCATSTTATWPRAASTRSPRSGSPSTSARRSCPRTSRSCTASCSPRAGCSTTASRGPTTSARSSLPGRLHRPLRLPRRRAAGARLHRLGDARRRLRGAPRGEPARALRAHAGGVVGQPRRRTGTRPSPRSARRKARIWRLYMAGSRVVVRPRTTSSCTRCSACEDRRAGASGMPLRPDWERGRAVGAA